MKALYLVNINTVHCYRSCQFTVNNVTTFDFNKVLVDVKIHMNSNE